MTQKKNEFGYEKKSDTIIVCVHDLFSDPTAFESLSRICKKQLPYSFVSFRLLGHGCDIKQLYGYTYYDYEMQLLTYLKFLATKYKRILLVGSGFGAVLCVDVSFYENVQKVVILNPPRKPTIRLRIVRAFATIMPSLQIPLSLSGYVQKSTSKMYAQSSIVLFESYSQWKKMTLSKKCIVCIEKNHPIYTKKDSTKYSVHTIDTTFSRDLQICDLLTDSTKHSFSLKR